MKKLFILAIASVVGGTAFAQTSSTAKATSYGLKVGVNLPKYQFQNEGGTDPETETTTNFHVTGYMDAPIGGVFSIQPGISLQGKGGKFYDNGGTGNARVRNEQNTLWGEIPVNIVAHIPMAGATNFYLGGGPYAALGISGENKMTNGTVVTENSIGFGNDSSNGRTADLKRFDLGVNFLAGVQLGNGFNVGAGYGLGLNDLRPSGNGGNGKMTNRVLSFSVGFGF
ncbi:MAG: hypothetical protein K0S09_420 [Sphingobacteriaceae bacterium]|jgi:hypothetical protein|nr:hypothetical protein [Sphingobacteriaceae bacterium]